MEKVFDFYADLEKWQESVPPESQFKVKKTSEGPVGIGTTYSYTGVLGGSNVNGQYKYAEFEKNRKITMHETKGDFKSFSQTLIFETTDKGTKVNAIFDYELPYSLLGKIMDKLKVSKELE